MTTKPVQQPLVPPIEYPDSDGQPMADNTLQFTWIVVIKENLESLFADHPNVFVAGDLLWYPVEGKPRIRRAPDAMVVFGRPKGYRGSYKQWEENGIAPQVVFEVLSPSNTAAEMRDKLNFYETYGVEEYYEYDPDHVRLRGWQRKDGQLQPIPTLHGWVSPRLGIRFALAPDTLRIFYPNGEEFQPLSAIRRERDAAQHERDAAQQALQRERQERERLAALLRSMGIDPDSTP